MTCFRFLSLQCHVPFWLSPSWGSWVFIACCFHPRPTLVCLLVYGMLLSSVAPFTRLVGCCFLERELSSVLALFSTREIFKSYLSLFTFYFYFYFLFKIPSFSFYCLHLNYFQTIRPRELAWWLIAPSEDQHSHQVAHRYL